MPPLSFERAKINTYSIWGLVSVCLWAKYAPRALRIPPVFVQWRSKLDRERERDREKRLFLSLVIWHRPTNLIPKKLAGPVCRTHRCSFEWIVGFAVHNAALLATANLPPRSCITLRSSQLQFASVSVHTRINEEELRNTVQQLNILNHGCLIRVHNTNPPINTVLRWTLRTSVAYLVPGFM